ncbi:MAG: MBL fold metallo-hydrolase [Candidatus Andeanibacterium colombiense]|uniref:MBL fold metallo-hydrolase n=1 Tax=Candidatus Andeanibacterium colombiense TaxID=3121345 RepID=A0AAJ5X764_9SPHN|nr:MAG: MBL fold metallo-hydrolase [Sphingomonadaceae bacterium]
MPRNRYYVGPESDHFDGRFFNIAPRTPDRGLRDVWRWRRTSTPTRWPDSVPITPTVPEAQCQNLRITIVGHACVLIQLGGLNLVTDPLWSERASPFSFAGPRRACPPGIAFADLPRIDAVLLSHNHYDHLDKATLRRLVARDDPRILTPLGNDAIVQRAIPRARIETGDWWDGFALGNGVEATIVPAQHWSARGVRDRRMALWGGFHVRSPFGSACFAGDTGYGDGSIFPAIRERLGAPDVALLPIGAYAPRWFMADQHTNPDEAVRIMQALGARRALGIHWGVFQLTDEGRDEPAELLARALAERGLSPECFPAAEPGQAFEF